MKKVNEKGFTLAELLIVVAVIAVLVAIAIPTFSDQLEKSREARDLSELRAAYASVMAASLEAPKDAKEITVKLFQTQNDWQTSEVIVAGTDIKSVTPAASGEMTVKYTYNNGEPKIEILNDATPTPVSVEIVDKFVGSLTIDLVATVTTGKTDAARYTDADLALTSLTVDGTALTASTIADYNITAKSSDETKVKVAVDTTTDNKITFTKAGDGGNATITITVTEKEGDKKSGTLTFYVSQS